MFDRRARSYTFVIVILNLRSFANLCSWGLSLYQKGNGFQKSSFSERRPCIEGCPQQKCNDVTDTTYIDRVWVGCIMLNHLI